ncbi:hypothetical protein GALMADRAFT_134731 [Galerina marginata CBS 339.88]|uniref:Cation/H+ exchanger transmembrane domain-containing protein n=1 Tax=Galerina marginata (strain CBS 339.88) TaxID=685588 RepID=A0A067TJ95_GALM3|nr:hypothetical protein GALMADRAFT_134731 [Galerina marginata CBS 339.88]
MAFWPFEVSTVHIVYAVLGGFIVLFGMFSLFLRERLYIGEAIWAFIFGIIIGPYCADIFNPRAWASSTSTSEQVTNTITLEFTRIVLAIGVFAIGVELPKAYMKKHWRSLFFLLVPVMTWGWFVSAALIYALIPGLNFLSSLAVAACLTPTDPILAAAVVGGKWADKHVPAHIRHLLAAESGVNDGAAFPFLYIALYLTLDVGVGRAVRDWVVLLWLYQVILGAIIGSILGFSFRHLMKFCQRHDLIDRHSYVAQYLSLAMLTIGLTTLLGSDDLLAAFFCGTAFAWDGFFNRQTEESVFSSVIDTLFNVAAFIYVGAWMPFSAFTDKGLTLSVWRLLVIAVLVLLLRRLPVMMALYRWIPDIKTFREAVFSGHFGPIGIGAVFISTLATEILADAHKSANSASADAGHKPPSAQTELLEKTIQPIVAFMVLCSITIHGLSIPGFSLGRRVHSVSRTWSRRDTVGSSGGRQAPDWTNQARMVSRAEDVVVNRDRDLEEGRGEVLDLGEKREEKEKRGEGEGEEGSGSGTTSFQMDDEKMAESGLSGETRVMPPPPPRSDSPHTRFVDFAGGGVGVVVSPGTGGSRPATRPATPSGSTSTRPGTPTLVGALPSPSAITTGGREHAEQGRGQGQGERERPRLERPALAPHLQHPQRAEPDAANPPDGVDGEGDVREWIEGDRVVVERRRGDGGDVEVTVIPNPNPSALAHAGLGGAASRWHQHHELGLGLRHGHGHGAEDLGHAISRELGHLGARAREAVSPSRRREEGQHLEEPTQGHRHQEQRQRAGAEEDTAVADEDEDEEDDEGWASEDNNGAGAGLPPSSASAKITRSTSRSSKPQQHAAHSRRRRASATASGSGPAVRRGSFVGGAPDVVEEQRGRSVDAGSSAGPSASSQPQPQSQPQAQHQAQAIPTMHTRPSFGALSRLGTSSSLSSSSSSAASTPRPNTSPGSSTPTATNANANAFFSRSRPSTARSSRPGTADSLGSPRNHRVESIRHGHGGSRRGTPVQTRENSPSRSVRFVDEAEFAGVGLGVGVGAGGSGSGRGLMGMGGQGLSESPVAEDAGSGSGVRGPVHWAGDNV